ncbi:protogenin-like [Saccoglossus kowalevskii]|uniref:Protogenin-like n=1 Tax=Saccoglossus kowalevskii TaxID=10224 RepID=A0ABM0GWE7_SACKO|nr:PREDICTED: protogenin-like [Saccoglossus kowalevskii]
MAYRTSKRSFYLVVCTQLLLAVTCVKGTSDMSELHFVVEPGNIVVETGLPFTWDCAAGGEDPVTITWKKDDIIINNDEHVRILANGSLYFDATKESELSERFYEGTYTCLATNSYGTIFTFGNIQLATLSRPILRPRSRVVLAGRPVRLRCLVQESIPEHTIFWQKNGVDLPKSYRYVVLPQGVLQIINFQPSDVGEYSCIAENTFFRKMSSTATFSIHNREESASKDESCPDNRTPKILSAPNSIVSLSGTSVTLECLVDSCSTDEAVPFVTWYKGGLPLSSNKFVPHGETNLKLEELNIAMAGVYKCEVTIPSMDINLFAVINLDILVPPEFLSVPESQIIPLQTTARFTCVVYGVPEPEITWYYNGEAIRYSGRFFMPTNRDLVISNVRKNPKESDEGVYQCVAENSSGRITAVALLTIEISVKNPNEPVIVFAAPVTTSSIALEWEAPRNIDGEQLIAYSVYYQPIYGGRTGVKVVSSDVTSCVVHSLLPHTNYILEVVAFSGVAASHTSDSVTVTTTILAPNETPTFNLLAIDSSSIEITWDVLAQNNGMINRYNIYYRKKTADSCSNIVAVTTNGTTYEYTAEDLDPDCVYEVQMAASTSAGEGPKSAWTSIKTLNHQSATMQSNFPSPPRNLTAFAVSSESIALWWEAPLLRNTIDDIISYYVHYQVNPDGAEHTITVDSDVDSYVVRDLLPLTNYTFYVEAYTSHGVSEPSDTIYEVTIMDADENTAPNFTVQSYSPRSALVEWDLVQFDECKNITEKGVRVYYRKIGENTTSYIDVEGSHQSHFFTDLEAGATYEVELSASDCEGQESISLTKHVLIQ